MKNTLLLILLLLTTVTFAQSGYEHLSVRAHGMGRTYVVSAKGLDAVGLNPARVYDEYGKQFELRIFPVASYGLDAGPSFRDPEALNNVFSLYTDNEIDSLDRINVVRVLQNNKLSGNGDVSVFGGSFKYKDYGTLAFTWSAHAALRTDIPDDFLDFLLTADAIISQTGGEYSDLDIQALWYNDFALSYGNRFYVNRNDSTAFLQFVDAGTSLKLISGIGSYQLLPGNYFNISTPFGGTPITMNYKILSSYSDDFDPQNAPNRLSFGFLTPSSAGSGFGIDIGAYAGFIPTTQKKPALLVGASLTDLGSITWSNKAQVRAVYDESRFFAFQGTVESLNDSLKAFSGNLHDTSSYSTSLPTTFRIGSTLDLGAMGKRWYGFYPAIAFEYAVGLSEVVGSFESNRIGFGLGLSRTLGRHEIRIGTGLAIQKDLTDITLGIGGTIANIISIDLATAHFLNLFTTGSTFDLAFSVKAAF